MASTDELALRYLKDLVAAAAPFARIERNWGKAPRLEAGGFFNIRNGVPDLVAVDLSPPKYNYQHEVPVVLILKPIDGTDGAEQFDQLLPPIGRAVRGDRSLGGRVDYADVTIATRDTVSIEGVDDIPVAEFSFLLAYATQYPLG